MTNCTIYGNVYASSGPHYSTTYTHTGSVYATLKDTAIRKFDTTVVDPMLKPNEIHNVGGSFWGLYGKVTENLYLIASGSYVAECGTWFTAKEDCKVGKSIDYTFNNIKENLRFVGAYQFPGYDQTEAYKGRITVNNTQVANVFGWGWLDLYGSSTCSQDMGNFGHMQYDSSFYNYWTEQKKQNENGGSYYAPGTYAPDLKGCLGYVEMKSSNIYSGGDCFDSKKGWNRQRFGRIVLKDNYNTFRIYNATGGNSTQGCFMNYPWADLTYCILAITSLILFLIHWSCKKAQINSISLYRTFFQRYSFYIVNRDWLCLETHTVPAKRHCHKSSPSFLSLYLPDPSRTLPDAGCCMRIF